MRRLCLVLTAAWLGAGQLAGAQTVPPQPQSPATAPTGAIAPEAAPLGGPPLSSVLPPANPVPAPASPLAARIQGYLDNPGSIPPSVQPADGTLRRFYARRQSAAAWREAEAWSPRTAVALDMLRHADQQGLTPRAYRPDIVAKALEQAPAGPADTPDAIDRIAVADLALSAAVLHYIRDVTGGGLDGTRFGWNIPWEYADPAQLLVNALGAPDLAAWFTRLEPQNQAYAGLKVLLARYRQIAEMPWAPIGPGPTLRPGDHDPRVRQLRQNLTTLGDLPAREDRSAGRGGGLVRVASNDPALGVPDAVPPAAGPLYDPGLAQGVRRFQARHGLNPDGIIGASTLQALDISPKERLNQIRANLQRLRWMPRELAPRFITVNNPAYPLQAVENDRVVLSMKVVAGQPDWPTPIMADWIVSLKFAPTWTIPPKIARTETLAKIKADPSYIARMGLDVLVNGRRIDPGSVHWWKLNARNFPYTLRQRPGKDNALGLIRFSLTNPYGIYLHDTSNPAAFRKWGRNLSHGCVRVEEPARLAAFVLNDPAWPAERLQAAMDEARPHIMPVPSPVPVFLVYFTAWRGAGGEAQFRADMYDLDGQLAAAL